MKTLLLISINLLLSSLCFAKYTVYDTSTQTTISTEDWITQLPSEGYLVLGETHYNPNVQQAHHDIINEVVEHKQLQGQWTLAMEFLNHPEQMELDKIIDSYKAGLLTSDQLLTDPLFDSMGPLEHRQAYLPLFEPTRDLDGQVLALNAPRTWRRVITQQGLHALTPEQSVPNMWVGGPKYHELFLEAMGGHGGPTVDKYFEAQCYVDSVMAYKAHTNYNNSYQFIVAGNFHTKYRLGTVERLEKLTSESVVTLETIDVSTLTEQEIEELKIERPNFGARADYLIFAE